MFQKSLKKNIGLNMIKTVMSLIFPLVTFPYVSRVLGPAMLGKINFANSIISYFAMVAALGISTYGIREAAKVRDNKCLLTKLVKEIFFINLISTIFAYILLIVSLFVIPKFIEYRVLLIICSGSIFFVTLGVDWLYTALEEFAYITIRSVVFQLISIILMFVFVKTSDDYLKYAAIGVVSSVGSNLCNFIHLNKYISIKTKVQKELRKHVKPIMMLFAMSVAVSIYTALDTTMLGFISGDEQVGYYTAATKINKIVIFVITAAVTVLLPRFSYYISQHNEEQFHVVSEKALNAVLLFSLPCSIGLCLVARPVILVFCGINYESAISTMRIINPIIVAISLSSLIGVQIFMPLGKEKITLISVIIGACLNFCLNMLFIPKYGAFGAGFASVMAESSVALFQIIYARKIFAWKNIFKHFIQCCVAVLIMSVIVYFVMQININIVLQLVCSVVFGGVVYFLSLILLRNKFCLSIIKEFYKK